MMEWIREGFAAVFLLAGFAVYVSAVIGMGRFRFVLNRMHAAAIGDTLGLVLMLSGLTLLRGFSFLSFKFLILILFIWVASPVSGHLISRLEVTTEENLEEYCEIQEEKKK